MDWIDIRVRKPTKADADCHKRVWMMCSDRSTGSFNWDNLSGCVAWMPIPKFVPAPDPPDGHRLVDTANEPFRSDALVHTTSFGWIPTERCGWSHRSTYAVPIDPPKPKYRPFANAAEFDAYRDKWWRAQTCPDDRRPPASYDDYGFCERSWEQCFDDYEFIDGTPFGVPVE